VQALQGKLEDALISRNAIKQEVEKAPPMLVVEAGIRAGNSVLAARPQRHGCRRPRSN